MKSEISNLLTKALEGSWRAEPPPPDVSAEELARVEPLLSGSGAAALAWWRVRATELSATRPAAEFRRAFHLYAVRAGLHEEKVGRVFARLRAAGVEPVLVKGWAAARLYPEAALRPYGDVDLCVAPRDYEAAREALYGARGEWYSADLHAGFDDLHAGFDVEEVYARTRLFKLGGADVRVLGAEDQLRSLCLHFLRHGGWRPLWLCDVAAAFEGRPEAFDWERLEGRDARRARWVACAVGLAHLLLGARTSETPYADAHERLPRWLVRGVLKRWERPFASEQAPMCYRAPMSEHLRRPRGLFKDLLRRWPDPLAATVAVGGPFNRLPRLPFQLASGLARAAHFFTRAARRTA